MSKKEVIFLGDEAPEKPDEGKSTPKEGAITGTLGLSLRHVLDELAIKARNGCENDQCDLGVNLKKDIKKKTKTQQEMFSMYPGHMDSEEVTTTTYAPRAKIEVVCSLGAGCCKATVDRVAGDINDIAVECVKVVTDSERTTKEITDGVNQESKEIMKKARKQAKDKTDQGKKKAESEEATFVKAEGTRISNKFGLSA